MNKFFEKVAWHYKGMTLIELLVVILITGLLSTLAAASFRTSIADAKAKSLADSFTLALKLMQSYALNASNPNMLITLCPINHTKTAVSCGDLASIPFDGGFAIANNANGTYSYLQSFNPSNKTTNVTPDDKLNNFLISYNPIINSNKVIQINSATGLVVDNNPIATVTITPTHCLVGWQFTFTNKLALNPLPKQFPCP